MLSLGSLGPIRALRHILPCIICCSCVFLCCAARTDNIRHVLKALTAVGQIVGMTADNAQRIASQCMFGAGDSEEGKEGKEDDNEDAYQLVPSEIWSSHINNTIIKTFQTHFLEEMTNTNLG